MPLHISAEPTRQDLPIPDDKAHRANDEARRAADLTASRATFERDLRGEIDHPVHRKIVEALQSRRLALYGLLSLALAAVLWWEWKVSRDIYEVTLPVSPWIPFSVFVSLSFLASALLAEGIPLFSLGFAPARTAGPDKATSAIESLYDRPRSRSRGGPAPWLLTGLLLTALVEGAIYFLSIERVKLMTEAGEIPEGLVQMQIWLPVALFAIDIALGIPAFFVAVAGYHTLRLRRQRATLTILRDQELSLQQSTVKQWVDYTQDLDAYNRWATQQGRGERLAVPPCRALRELLRDHDDAPTRTDTPPAPESPDPAGSNATNPGGPARPAAGDNSAQNPSEMGRDGRVDELLHLVDEQIAAANRRI